MTRFLNTVLAIVLMLFASIAIAHERPISFIENRGQWGDDVRYKVDISLGAIFFEETRITYSLLDMSVYKRTHTTHEHLPDSIRGHAFRMSFVGTNNRVPTSGKGKSSHYSNYFIGNDSARWASHAHSFEEVNYTALYNGIDMRVYGHNGHLKYDMMVAPHAEAGAIRMEYEGVDGIRILENGDLSITTSLLGIIESSPIAFQEVNGVRREVPCSFKLDGQVVSFHFPQGYDEDYALVIDPEIVFASYVGSTTNNFGSSATYDAAGNLYGAGTTFGVGYPTTMGAFQTASMGFAGGPCDIGISKFAADGSTLIYSTYLGGTSNETVHSTIVNANNELYVLGTSNSADFPVSGNAFQPNNNLGQNMTWSLGYGITYPDGTDMVVARLSPNGDALLSSTFVGGSDNDGVNVGSILDYNYGDPFRGEINIDGAGNVLVASSTESSDFPVTNGAAQTVIGGARDGVVFKMNPNLSQMLWATFIGGVQNDNAYSVQFTSTGEVVAAGGTLSINFPTTAGAYRTVTNGQADGWVMKLAAANGAVTASSYIGSASYDQVYFVQIDFYDRIYVLGQTTGSIPLIPSNVYANPSSGQFIQKLSNGLDSLLMSTTVGRGTGEVDISPTAFLVSICGQIYLSGWGGSTNNANGNTNNSTTTSLPVSIDAFQPTTDGHDFYLMVLDANASNLVYATFFGGGTSDEHVDGGTSRFDKNGIVYQAVCAGCGGHDDFPTTPGVWSPTNGADCNLGVFKFNLNQIVAVPEFDVQLNGCAYPLNVIFTNTSTGANAFEWNLGDGTITTLSNFTHPYQTPGTYNISLVAMDSTGCLLTDTGFVDFTIPVPPEVQAFGTDTICANESVPLGATASDSSLTYTWAPGHTLSDPTALDPIATPEVTTEYFVTVTDSIGCQNTSGVTIYVAEPIDPEAGEDIYLETMNPLQLQADIPPDAIVQWSPAEGLSCTSCFNPIAFPQETTTYYLEITNSFGCISTDSVVVYVFPTLYIPNAFTPTGNKINPVFLALGTGIRTFSMTIFNRWGQEIFTSNDIEQGWDGTFNGSDAQQGVYTYKASYTSDIYPEQERYLVGHVTLVR
jgi:gliding motility-associated-like protein